MGIMSESPFSQSFCKLVEPKTGRKKRKGESKTSCFKLSPFFFLIIVCLLTDFQVSLYVNSGIWLKEDSLTLAKKLLSLLSPFLMPSLSLSNIRRRTHTHILTMKCNVTGELIYYTELRLQHLTILVLVKSVFGLILLIKK